MKVMHIGSVMKSLLVLFAFIAQIYQVIGQELNYDTLTYYKINKKAGIINNKGKVIVKPMYDLLSFSCRDSLIAVTKNERDGFIDRKGNVVIPLAYKFVFSFHNGLFIGSGHHGKSRFYR